MTDDRSRAREAFTAVVQLVGGNVTGAGRVVLVESVGHEDRALGWDAVVFSPGGSGAAVGYEGGLVEPGDEFLVGDDLFVHTQDYLATPFLAVAGPTIVRVGGDQDYESFLQDADLARDQGVFVEQLTTPGVFLADQCALGTTHPCAGAGRLHVDASGDVRTAPGGEVLGSIESDVDSIAARAAALNIIGDVCLNAVVSADAIEQARAARPWLSRYLRALAVLRGLRAEGRSGLRVSGFGGRFVEGLPADLVEHVDAPILLWGNGEQLLCDTTQDRVFQVGADAARIIELLLVAHDAGHAVELATVHTGLDADVARDATDRVIAAFDSLQSVVRAGITSPAS
ncbi:daptide biosynthesis RiPP recognition protein [Lentzea sp. JNUCC 0626]|uniref:daptide biosynthesis RiPP recognition protein n=1 Tax=Lentzea sp. JNUCC 0626 TaxID=3367513 RepID=UPI00374958A7